MPRIDDNRASETIAFNGSGAQRIIAWDPGGGAAAAAGLARVYVVARRDDGATFVDSRKVHFLVDQGTLTLGDVELEALPLAGAAGLDVAVVSAGALLAVDLAVDPGAAGAWTATATIDVEGVTLA